MGSVIIISRFTVCVSSIFTESDLSRARAVSWDKLHAKIDAPMSYEHRSSLCSSRNLVESNLYYNTCQLSQFLWLSSYQQTGPRQHCRAQLGYLYLVIKASFWRFGVLAYQMNSS